MILIKTGQDAREALKRGIDKVYSYIIPTLGNAGKTASLGRENMPPLSVDDAISIIMNIELEDEFENEAVWKLKESLMNTSKKVGDATATTMALIKGFSDAIFDKMKDKGSLIKDVKYNTITLKKELDKSCKEISEILITQAKQVKPKDLYNIALTAGTYDWIADITSNVFSKIGANGYFEIEEGIKTDYKISNGLELPVGFDSEYYINTDDKECRLEDVAVFVTNQSLNTDFFVKTIPLLKSSKYKSAIVIAPNFEREAIAGVLATHLETFKELQFTVVTLKLPTFDKDELLLDIASLTGASFLDRARYIDYASFLNDVTINSFGAVKKAILTSTSTTLVDGDGDTTQRVKDLNLEYSQSLSEFDKDKLEKRIASLSGGSALIKIGGYPDTELNYFKLKLENACHSVQNSLKKGCVRGGGLALYQIAQKYPNNFISEAIRNPYKAIQANNGQDFEIPLTVNDAVINVLGALESARSFAGDILMTELLTTHKRESKTNKNED